MSKTECANLYKLQSCYAEVTKKCQNILATHLHVKIPTSLLFTFRSEHYWDKDLKYDAYYGLHFEDENHDESSEASL